MSIGWQLASQITSLMVSAVTAVTVHLSNRPRTTRLRGTDRPSSVSDTLWSSDQRADLEVIARQP
jgi:hypothetical protein